MSVGAPHRCMSFYTGLFLASASLGCGVCPCQVGAVAVQAPGAAGEGGGSAAPAIGGGGHHAASVAYAWKSVTILGGGFVSGVVFSPAEKGLAYARTDVGGAYRLNPADGSWVPMTDGFGRDRGSMLYIESIAADPVDANRVYAAVGDYVKPWAHNGAILRSGDRGETWTVTDMPMQMGGNENGRSNGERLAVDPNDPNVIYFGSRAAGLWRSTDAAATWSKVSSFPVSPDASGFGIPVVVFDKPSGKKGKATPTIYAAVAKTDGTLYVSSDAGATWKLLSNQPTGFMASHAAFDDRRTLYVTYGSGPGPNDVVDGAVWKYEPEQGKFTNVTPQAPQASDRFGYGGLAVDAAHPGTVMVTTIDRWTKGDEVYRTIDGGKKWKAVGSTGVHDDGGAKYLDWHRDKPSSMGWMGCIAVDPFDPGHALYVTGQGIWGSDDANASDAADKPVHWSFRDRNLEETVVAGVVSPPAGPPLLSVVGDLGGFRHDDLNAPSPGGMFDNPIFGSGSAIDVAWSKPEIVARVGNADKDRNGAYSIDGGVTWRPFATMPKGGRSGSIAVAADGTTLLWAPKEGPVVYSRDHGATWSRAEGLPEQAKTPDWARNAMRLSADRVNPSKFYVYDARGGRAYATSDRAAHFAPAPNGLPSLPDYNLTVGSIQAAPGIEGDVWVTTGKEIYHSADSGKSYRSLGGVAESYGLGFGKAAEGKASPAMYLIGKLGDSVGFFRSDDRGGSWARINDDRHQYGGADIITGDPRVYGRVYVGTGGRGIVYGEPK